jgi:hypothetical protein
MDLFSFDKNIRKAALILAALAGFPIASVEGKDERATTSTRYTAKMDLVPLIRQVYDSSMHCATAWPPG